MQAIPTVKVNHHLHFVACGGRYVGVAEHPPSDPIWPAEGDQT